MTEITVTHADREAAWPTRPILYGGDYHKGDWHKGVYDNGPIIQSYAAHRLASIAAERERGQKLADWLVRALKIIDRTNGMWMGESDARNALSEWEAGK